MYNPLPKSLTIKKSKIHGLGLFAEKDIPADTNLGLTHIKHTTSPQNWLRTPLGGFYNHSEEPNCELITTHRGKFWRSWVESKELRTLKDIIAGDELTCFYSLWNINSINV
jgi:SET domain-containing protein